MRLSTWALATALGWGLPALALTATAAEKYPTKEMPWVYTADFDVTRGTTVDHRADDVDGLQLTRAPINEITDKERRAFGVVPATTAVPVAEPAQKPFECGVVPVDVTDDVVGHVLP